MQKRIGEGAMEQGTHEELLWQYIRELYRVDNWEDLIKAVDRAA